jgi:Tfp pilus assembly protein PilF
MNNKDMLLTNTLSTPMVYYVSYPDTAEDISLKYGGIKFGTAADIADFFNAGVSALKNKNVGLAVNNFSKILEMVPNFVPAMNNLAALYHSIGRTPESIYCFEQGLKKDPKNFQMRYNLGTLYCLNSNYDLAKEQLMQAKSLLPNDVAIENNLALSLLDSEDILEAKNILENVIEKNENFDIAFHNYAHLLGRAGEYDKAVEFYHKALEKNNKSYVTLNDLACCLYKQGKVADAIALFNKIAGETNYQFTAALHNLGYIVAKNNLLDFDAMKN